jgi:hypothetical protein
MDSESQINSVAAPLNAVEESIKENPLTALGMAALAGFVVGGGYRSKLGISLIWLAGRVAMRRAVIAAVSRAVDHDGRSGEARKRSRRGTSGTAPDAETDQSEGRDAAHSA